MTASIWMACVISAGTLLSLASGVPVPEKVAEEAEPLTTQPGIVPPQVSPENDRSIDQMVINKVVGSSVTLTPAYAGDSEEIIWWLNDRILVDIWVKKEKVTNYHLPDRAAIHPLTGHLTIRELTRADSGNYRASVLRHEKIQDTNIKLNVIDAVSPPVIHDHSTEEQLILACVSSTPNVSYKWRNKNGDVLSHQLLYTATTPKEKITLICVVSDGLSEKSESITVPREQEVARLGGGAVAGIVIVLLVCSAVPAVWLYHIRNRLNCFPYL